MGLKSLLLFVLVALGVVWGTLVWSGDEGDVDAGTDTEVVSEADDTDGEPISLKRSAPASAENGARREGASTAERERLQRAESLLGAGQSADAAEIAAGLRRSSDGAVRARAAYLLAWSTDDWLTRRRLFSEALGAGAVHGAEFERVREALAALNVRPATSLLPAIETASYVVEPGDSLWVLCNKVFPKRFGVFHEVGLVQLVNGTSSTSLRVGDTLEVPLEPLRIVVFSGDHGLVCMLGDVAVSTFHVGLGRESRTPVGDFTIEVKQENPDWYHDGRVVPFGDPENVLGTRWMGFANRPGASGFGIHGTAHPESIGLNESMGCIRMRNEEVEDLFAYVARGTVVSILD